MNDTLDELNGWLRRGVQRWRDEEPSAVDVDAALSRIAARGRASQGRTRRLPAALAAGLLVLLLIRVPAAWAEVNEAIRDVPQAAPVAKSVGNLRAVLIVHVVFIMAAFLPFALGWGLLQLDLVSRLFGVDRLRRLAGKVAPWAAGAGTLLWLVGMVLGMVWASGAMGRAWGWDGKEIAALVTLLIGGGWCLLAGRFRGTTTAASALVAAVAFWLILDVWWGSLSLVRGTGLWASALVIGLATVLNAVLLVGTWRRREAVQS